MRGDGVAECSCFTYGFSVDVCWLKFFSDGFVDDFCDGGVDGFFDGLADVCLVDELACCCVGDEVADSVFVVVVALAPVFENFGDH